MKLGKLSLVGISLLGFILFLVTVFTYSDVREEDMANAGISAYLFFGLITVVIAFGLFLVYKFTDLGKFPAHRKEMLFLIGVIAVSVILGFILGGGDWIKAIIVSFVSLLLVSFAFLIVDTVKSIVK